VGKIPFLAFLVNTATPKNPQNNDVYAPAATKTHVAPECLLQTHSTFSKSVMVSMGCSKLWLIDLIFMQEWRSMAQTTMTSHASDSKATACDAWDLCRILYLSTMQCFCRCSPRVRDNQPPGTTDRRPFTTFWHQTAQIWTRLTTKAAFWLMVLSKVLSMTQEISGDCGADLSVLVFVWK